MTLSIKKKRDNFINEMKSLGEVLYDGPYSLKVEMRKEPDASRLYFDAIRKHYDAVKVDRMLHVHFE